MLTKVTFAALWIAGRDMAPIMRGTVLSARMLLLGTIVALNFTVAATKSCMPTPVRVEIPISCMQGMSYIRLRGPKYSRGPNEDE